MEVVGLSLKISSDLDSPHLGKRVILYEFPKNSLWIPYLPEQPYKLTVLGYLESKLASRLFITVVAYTKGYLPAKFELDPTYGLYFMSC